MLSSAFRLTLLCAFCHALALGGSSDTSPVKVWTYKPTKTTIGRPVFDSRTQRLFVNSYSPYVAVLDANTGLLVPDGDGGTFVTEDYNRLDVAVYGDTAYLASDDGIIAFDTQTLHTRWTSDISMRKTPVISHDYVFVVPSSSEFGALNRTTGLLAWTYTAGVDEFVALLQSPTGALALTRRYATFSVTNLTTQSLLWSYTSKRTYLSEPAFNQKQTMMYLGISSSASTSGYVDAVNMSDGSALWSRALAGAVADYPPSVGADGTVYVGGKDKYAYALDGTTGAIRWKTAVPLTTSERDLIYSMQLLVHPTENTVIGAGPYILFALDSASGQLLWTFDTGFCSAELSLGPDGTVYVACDSTVFAVKQLPSSGLSIGSKVGIAVGVIAVVALIVAGVVFWRRRKARQRASYQPVGGGGNVPAPAAPAAASYVPPPVSSHYINTNEEASAPQPRSISYGGEGATAMNRQPSMEIEGFERTASQPGYEGSETS